MTLKEAKKTFGEMMQKSHMRPLTAADRNLLAKARQVIRMSRRPASNKAKRLTKAKALKILREGRVRGRKLTKKARRFFGARASGYPKRNPALQEPERIGKAVEVRYHRDVGRHRGYYKHTFTSRNLAVTVLPTNRKVVVEGGVLIGGKVRS